MIKTTVVGSYPVPMWLRVTSNRDSLRDAVMVVFKTQELAGIDVVADGELHRWDINHADTNGMIDYFVRPLSGVETALSAEQLRAWRSRPEMAFRAEPAGVVRTELGPGTLDLARDFNQFRHLTTAAIKFTVTSPLMLAKTLADDHYGDPEKLVMALADILKQQVSTITADVIQVDEAFITGHPEEAKLAAAGINRVLEGVTSEKAVHLCYGNYGGQTIQKGTYQRLLEFLNLLTCDHVVLEIARRPETEFLMLKDVKSSIGLGIGVIDIKDNEIETPELVARRIEQAADAVGPERIRYVHPDCGFWMLPRSVADGKMRTLVAGRNLYEGR